VAVITLRLTRKAEGVPAVLALNPVFARATADRKVTWQITLDGAVVGTIAAGQTVELPIEKGYHTLRLNSARHHSPERSFEAADGQVASFTCRTAVAFWPVHVAAAIKPDLWISLRQR
jgi:hypothetical protein